MKVKLQVTFDITLDSSNGKSKAVIKFKLPGHPDAKISDTTQKFGIQHVHALSGHMLAHAEECFPEAEAEEELED